MQGVELMKQNGIPDDVYADYLKALLAGEKRQCIEMVNRLLQEQVSLHDLYIQLFQRALYRVGELWEQNRISVAVEHMATAITESLLTLVYPLIFSAEHIGRKAVVSCVASEYHQIGGKMAADIFELNGWDGYFLGANTPPEELLRLIQQKKPDVLGLSLSVYFNMDSLCSVLDLVRSSFPDLPVVVGGQAFRWGGREKIEQYPSVTLIPTLGELESFIRRAS
jgi:methanogenic corrinoid protein MtbC1